MTAASFTGTWTPVDPKPTDINKTPQYYQVAMTAQSEQLSIKFASVCNPVTYINFLTTTVTLDNNLAEIKVKDAVGGASEGFWPRAGLEEAVKVEAALSPHNNPVRKRPDFRYTICNILYFLQGPSWTYK